MEESLISPVSASQQISWGDIIVESVTFEDDEYVEIARYLIVGKLIEIISDEPFQLEEKKNVYFKTVLLYVGREHDSAWARMTNPGSKYLLSENEVTNYHDWRYCHKSDLNWVSGSIQMEESGIKWDEWGW